MKHAANAVYYHTYSNGPLVMFSRRAAAVSERHRKHQDTPNEIVRGAQPLKHITRKCVNI